MAEHRSDFELKKEKYPYISPLRVSSVTLLIFQ